ncbi:MAG: SulP family inorganic anion transporter [Thermodesulfobacteriota bacterium]|nr:SulP family inorganic anion transporter [Thermodesulfobacteriota bacterium]
MSVINGIKVSGKTFLNDVRTGLVMALISVPGGLANGLLAGVNPVFGLYSIIAGTTVAAFFTSSVIMNVDSTSATALATLETLSGIPAEQHLSYLVVLGLLVGFFMLVIGLLKLGFLVRFISNAVMTGFLSGLGILTVLGQVGDLTGFSSEKGNRIFKLIDTINNWPEILPAPLMVGLVTILIIVIINRTHFEKYSLLAAVLLTTLLVALANFSSVSLVGDVTRIPRSLPSLHLPDISLIPSMALPALTIAVIALVQAAGVSGSVPNPDGEYPDPSGDFRGQGAGNLAVGLVGGIPVGGSVSGTILIQNMGGQSRWANVATGIIAGLAVLLIAPFIEKIPMATLAGLLITVGFSMINVHRIQTVWNTGRVPMAIMVITFAATLVVPIQAAVGLGVVLHIVLHVFRSAERVRIERIVSHEDGGYMEVEPPSTLESDDIVILEPIGSLFFAGASEFESDLPDIGDARRTVVIFRLRDRDEVDSTFIRVLKRYASTLHARGNLLLLAGLNRQVTEQLKRTGLYDLIGEDNIFLAQSRFAVSMEQALARAKSWQTLEQNLEKDQTE